MEVLHHVAESDVVGPLVTVQPGTEKNQGPKHPGTFPWKQIGCMGQWYSWIWAGGSIQQPPGAHRKNSLVS